MATTYTGDPTLPEAPSAAPHPDSVPILTLPSDGDAANAASVAQAYKALANEVAWLKAPRAASFSLAEAVRRYRNARMLTRAAIDPFGFANGNVTQWDENWQDANLFNPGTPTYSVRQWGVHVDTGGLVQSQPPQFTAALNFRSRLLQIAPATGAPGGRVDISLLPQHQTAVFDDDSVICLWWSFMMQGAASFANETLVMGFTTNTGVASSIPDGAWFAKAPADVDWKCHAASGGVEAATVDSAVTAAPGTFHTAGIVLVGANQSNDSLAHALYFIDDPGAGGSLSIQSTNLPRTGVGAGAGVGIAPIFGIANSGAPGGGWLGIGPVRYRQNLFTGDAFI